MTPLSLEPSKRIHALIGDYETEKVWSIPNPDRASSEKEKEMLKASTTEVYSRKTKWGRKFDAIPAPTFAEVVRI